MKNGYIRLTCLYWENCCKEAFEMQLYFSKPWKSIHLNTYIKSIVSNLIKREMTFENIVYLEFKINRKAFCKLATSIRISYPIATIQFLLFKFECPQFRNIWGAGRWITSVAAHCHAWILDPLPGLHPRSVFYLLYILRQVLLTVNFRFAICKMDQLHMVVGGTK